MNIIMFVMTLIMLLTTLTYARLENYRFQALIQTDFEYYLQEVERKKINEIANDWYNKITVKSKEKGSTDTQGEPKAKVTASPKISWYYFLHPEAREQEPEKFRVLWNLNKQLMLVLFEQQPFFKKVQATRAHILDELLLAFIHAIDQLPDHQKPKKVSDFSHLNLEDLLLNTLSYKMFKGLPPLLDVKKEEVKEDGEGGSSEVSDSKEKEEEFSHSHGYHSLLNYVTLKNEKIRLFLASKPVLMAIVGEEKVAEEIIRLRKDIYRDLKNNKNKMTIQEASQQFEYMIKTQITLSDESLIDFTVTKINPKNYE